MNFVLNGVSTTVSAHPMSRLLDVLRDECGLTGTKEGCGEGECGACTVLIDGAPVCSCLVPVCQVSGATVLTIEGLRGEHPLQQLFMDEVAAQAGNLCRCTGYAAIYRAVLKWRAMETAS
jgi:aerobic carbon-monoxide dehydrogenase small subunit